MPIAIACPSCRGKFKAPDHAAGRTVKCPKCGSAIAVPDTLPEMDDFPAKPQGKHPARSRKGSEVGETGSSVDDEPTRGRRPNRTVLYLALGGGGLLVLILIGVAVLVSGQGDAKKRAGEDAQPVEQANGPAGGGGNPSSEKTTKPGGGNGSKAVPSRPTEEEAKSKLKLALDSWVFGDAPEKFRKDHPDIRVGVRRHGLDKLARYEIGSARTTPLGYEFMVTHVFESTAGTEVRRTGNVTVARFEGGQWFIQGLGGDD